jgi:predicted nucleotidyltransferase
MDIQYYLQEIVRLFRKEMMDNLVGIYLHGSLAMRCFNPDKSDIDFLVIAKNKLTFETKKVSRENCSLCTKNFPITAVWK